MLKNDGSYERDIQQRCAAAYSAFNALTKWLWSNPITSKVKHRIYLPAVHPIKMYGLEAWAAPLTAIEELDCMERELFRGLLGFWLMVCHNEDLYSEVDTVYRWMTREKL
ncbi:hypothetical protein RB195_025368 [Necator americanus]|uniref:Uncharacterized protein n=1 Tax=Necator americanus TaxID=51031 RepID=A0ABR1ES34_NECAM